MLHRADMPSEGKFTHAYHPQDPPEREAPFISPPDHLHGLSISADLVSARAQASMLHRTIVSRPVRATPFLLRLQRQYGNRHVQCVLALSRQSQGEEEISPEVEEVIQRVRGSGQALDSGARGQMESAFNADFSGVRVHTDAQADALNQAVNAVAFTTGQDVFFRQGAYNPGHSSGRELLAHELTHVVQQGGSTVQGKLVLGEPGDQYEQEADVMARQVANAPVTSLYRQCACGGASASGSEYESCRSKSGAAVQAQFLQRVSHCQLQRRVVCPPGVSEEDGTGCYEAPDAEVSNQDPANQTPADQNYTLADQTPDAQTPPAQVGAAVYPDESIHPEEQDADDTSKDPDASCGEIIRQIENVIELLAGRKAAIENLGGDPGHLKRFQILQGILKALMAKAVIACTQGEYDEELAEEAAKWADLDLRTSAAPEPGPSPAPQPIESPSSTWDKVLKVVIVLGLSIALVATIVAALADPEPASKLALAGLTVEEIEALGAALGFATAAAR